MKNLYILPIIILIAILSSCSSGKKALQKGDYFSAVSKSIQRLKTDPNNKKATAVLRDSYQLTLDWTQEEMDIILSGNNSFKWERAINLMNQVNNLARQIRQTPAARKVVANPKTYSSELNMALDKAALERYNAGLCELGLNTRESARTAFDHFRMSDRFVSGYKDIYQKMEEAKQLATINVVLEAIPVNTVSFKLSSEFFYKQVFNYLNQRYPRESFVNFYSPQEAEAINLPQPDYIVAMHFFDFSVGNLVHNEKEEIVKKRVKLESKDTTSVQYKNYKAKIKTFSDEVYSGGMLEMNIFEDAGNKRILTDRIPGSFTWLNEYAIFVGDIEALDKNQQVLVTRKAVPLPPKQDLFVEFTRPIYDQLTGKLNHFFRRFN